MTRGHCRNGGDEKKEKKKGRKDEERAIFIPVPRPSDGLLMIQLLGVVLKKQSCVQIFLFPSLWFPWELSGW